MTEQEEKTARIHFTNLEKERKLVAPLAPQLGIELGSEDSQIKYLAIPDQSATKVWYLQAEWEYM